jgi:hypothetical protein
MIDATYVSSAVMKSLRNITISFIEAGSGRIGAGGAAADLVIC